jgi:FkbM family methyltransferase
MRLPYPLRTGAATLLAAVPVPVPAGPNAGRLWSLASAGRGFLTGGFERDRVAAILALLRPGDTFWDVGAHKGYVTMAAARRVGPAGAVVACEPSRRNLRLLRRHVRWNRAGNVTVVDAALSGEKGEASFGGTGSSITYRLGHGDETVRVRRLDALVTEGLPAPTVAKIDVEGEEAGVLAGMGAHLGGCRVVFVAVHHAAAHRDSRAILDAAGFEVVEDRKMRRFTEGGGAWAGDADLVALAAASGVTRSDVEALPAYGGPAGA